MNEMYERTEMLIGHDAVRKLKDSSVAVFGCGGVGSYITEALARAGVGHIAVIDGDSVAASNINRQLIATVDTVGMPKVDAMKERIKAINPDCAVDAYHMFYSADTADNIPFAGFDYVADAIDTVSSKLIIIERAKAAGVPVISSMGTGNKLDPTRFRISDISTTSVCPLARAMRKLLKDRGIKGVKVLWSDEEPAMLGERKTDSDSGKVIPASISFVPSVAGLIIAGEIIRDICELRK